MNIRDRLRVHDAVYVEDIMRTVGWGFPMGIKRVHR